LGVHRWADIGLGVLLGFLRAWGSSESRDGDFGNSRERGERRKLLVNWSEWSAGL